MTPQQKQLLDYLRRFPGDGVQPSITEMSQFMRLKGRGGVHRMLQLLQQEGLVEKIDAGTRCWRAKPIDPFAGIEDSALIAELERRGFDVTAERKRLGWTVCPDCNGDSPNWRGNRVGCPACENEGGWKS